MIDVRCIKIRVRICVEPDGDRYYAYCPELKGVHEDGDSVEAAVYNAKESAHVYIESILRHNDPLPLCVEEIDLSFFALLSILLQKIKSKVFPKKNLITQVEDLEVSFA